MMYRTYFGKWRLPYPGLFPFAVITQVSKQQKRPDYDNGMPPSLIKIMISCWDADPGFYISL